MGQAGKGRFYGPAGCDKCGPGRGYRGTTAIFEILEMNDRLRQLVSQRAGASALMEAAVECGMKTMLVDGLEKAAAGVTSIEEVLRVVPPNEVS